MNIALMLALVIVIFFVVVFIFQFLWDWTMPEVFGLKPTTFWQALRLLLIAGMLFGSGSFIRFH